MKKTVKKVLLNLLLELFIVLIIGAVLKVVINSQFKVGNNLAVSIADFWYSLKYKYPVNLTYALIASFALLLYFLINKSGIIVKVLNYLRKNKRLLNSVFAPLVIFAICYIIVLVIFWTISDILFIYCDSFTSSALSNAQNIWDEFKNMYRIDLTSVCELIASLILYFKVYGKRIKELRSIINDTQKVAGGDLDTVMEKRKYKDFKELSDNINNLILTLKDVTKKEKESQQTKNDLITNVSHDLRTPLTIILGYLDIIDNDKYEDEVKLRYYVSIAHEKARELNVLTNDLFELTKMQGNDIKITKSRINIVELVGQITAQFGLLFVSNNMISRVSLCDEKLYINGDGEMLARVFNNIISNSIKYGRDGTYLDVSVIKNDGKAVIDVVNYGEEIAPSELPYIFDRLYRVEKSRNRETGGSGLGLAIAKEIVEKHDGTIRAYSSKEKTIFEVELNLIQEQ